MTTNDVMARIEANAQAIVEAAREGRLTAEQERTLAVGRGEVRADAQPPVDDETALRVYRAALDRLLSDRRVFARNADGSWTTSREAGYRGQISSSMVGQPEFLLRYGKDDAMMVNVRRLLYHLFRGDVTGHRVDAQRSDDVNPANCSLRPDGHARFAGFRNAKVDAMVARNRRVYRERGMDWFDHEFGLIELEG